MADYDPHSLESKWQAYWKEHRTFSVGDLSISSSGLNPNTPKAYILDMFPYPSGTGLHIGHPVGYTGSDILARFRRHQGYTVLHPMGYDSFGLPSEQHAIATGQHPEELTTLNCDRFTKQLQNLGFSYDWDRALKTSDASYYKWTQWIFLKLYDSWFDHSENRARPIAELEIPANISNQGLTAVAKYKSSKRLAFMDDGLVNWCPNLGTVLANEEVIDGKSERGGHDVIRRPMRQWFLRITAYAERLLSELEDLDWPESIKDQQRHWIGKRNGCNVTFKVSNTSLELATFTTRVDTLFGVTFVVLSPEHPLVAECTAASAKEGVNQYCERASHLSDLDRTIENREKTGVFTGTYAVNPINGESIPIFIGDYVLMGVGTGAVMGVPAHDDRDFAFAQKYNLLIRPVVSPPTSHTKFELVNNGLLCWTDPGTMIDLDNPTFHSLNLVNAPNELAKEKIALWLEEHKYGSRVTTFRLRDWLFSRQRYWGEPIPIVHWEDGSTTALSENELPLTLPPSSDFKPTGTGESPLARIQGWVNVTCPETGMKGKRETNTMPQWAGSCWYYLRFIDPLNTQQGWNPELEKAWMPVDFYIGGAEHAVLHLLYARFWHKVLYDLSFVSTKEPFHRLFNQGMIVSHAYKDSRGALVPIDEVTEKNDGFHYRNDTGEKVERIVAKMSKSLRNVVNPDDIIAQYGADTLRIFLMFMAPLEAMKPWNSDAITGCHRFLKRCWTVVTQNAHEGARDFCNPEQEDPKILKSLHRTIKKVTENTEALRYNSAIAAMMEFINEIIGFPISKNTAENLCLMLSPYAPHIAEELWLRLGHELTIAKISWPTFDEQYLVESTGTVVIQVQGKKRATIEVPVVIDDSALKDLVIATMVSTPYPIGEGGKIIIVRDRATGFPKLVNVV